ncbi:MAG: MATE family efflux transporter [Firmicutes bacterium]|nr:MATE family efflux transporter [Bacillota bacterium]
MNPLINRLFGVEYMVKPDLRRGDLPTNREAYRTELKIATPSMCEMIFLSLIGMMDTLMVSTLGTYAISSVGLTNQPRMILLAIFFALNVGVTAVVARRKGEGRQEEARMALRQAMVMISLIAILIMILYVFVSKPLMRLAGAKADTLGPSTDYFRIICLGLLCNALTMAICAALRGVGDTKITMKVNITANIVNVIFNYLLIGGHFGFPRLEVRGAAIATVIGQAVGMVMALRAVFRKDSYFALRLRDSWRLSKDVTGTIIKVGSNAVIEQIAMRVGFFITSRLIADLGTVDFAVNQICGQITTFSFTFADGTGTATASLVGQNLGRKRPDLSMMSGRIGQRLVLVISALLIIIFLVFRYPLIGLFSSDPVILEKGAACCIVMAIIIPFQMLQIVVSGSLRGAGDTRFVANTMLLCVMVIRPVMTYLCVYVFGFGVIGAWTAMLVDQCFRLTLVMRRFSSGRWATIRV